jgi:hypothetical protein
MERARKMVANPKMFNRDNLVLAHAYLDLFELAEAVEKESETRRDWMFPDIAKKHRHALQDALKEKP